MSKKAWVWVGLGVVVLILVVYAVEQNSIITVYPVFCKDWGDTPPAVRDFSTCKQPYAYARETFNADTSKNQVIETSPDTSDVDQLDPCTIQDAQHWSCGNSGNEILGATQTSRSGDNFSMNGLINTILSTESQWNSINNGAPSAQ